MTAPISFDKFYLGEVMEQHNIEYYKMKFSNLEVQIDMLRCKVNSLENQIKSINEVK